MTKKIVSFGDSFIFGNELADLDPPVEFGHCLRAWPALLARQLGVDYETCAVAGCGNEDIARQIYTYFSKNPKQNTVAVINWTWSMRWDFYMHNTNTWVTLGPTCVPEKLYQHVGHNEAKHLIEFYNHYTGASIKWNYYRSLQAIFAAQQFLKINQIPAIQTYMDTDLFSKFNTGNRVEHYNSYKDASWPLANTEDELDALPDHIKQELNQDYNQVVVPEFIAILQDLTLPDLKLFEGKNFLEWSRSYGYPITPYDHPLEQAHQAAADLWHDHYRQVIDTMTN